MAIGAIIIGDEILSGKRQDGHMAKLIELLSARGMQLDWAQYLGDDRARLTASLARSFDSGDIVFSFGGIGATPDDHTRQAAAAALGVELVLHPEAEAEIRGRFGAETTAQRLQLGHFPVGAAIIPNPYNRIAGFAIREHWFVPGFPVMAWPMVEWVLDTHYRHLHHAVARAEKSIIVWEGMEGQLIDLMQRIEADYPGVSVFSLPSVGSATVRRHIELGVKGDPAGVDAALAEVKTEMGLRKLAWQDKA